MTNNIVITWRHFWVCSRAKEQEKLSKRSRCCAFQKSSYTISFKTSCLQSIPLASFYEILNQTNCETIACNHLYEKPLCACSYICASLTKGFRPKSKELLWLPEFHWRVGSLEFTVRREILSFLLILSWGRFIAPTQYDICKVT